MSTILKTSVGNDDYSPFAKVQNQVDSFFSSKIIVQKMTR